MPTYSTDDDLYRVIPNANDFIPASMVVTTYLETQRSWAYDWINQQLEGNTLVPTTEDLSEVEAFLTAYRLLRQNFSSKDMDASRDFYLQYKRDAVEALQTHVFPATASIPEKIHSFASYTGAATMTVTAFDLATTDSNWVVKCFRAGAGTSLWEIYSSRHQRSWQYDLASDDQFPNQAYREGAGAGNLFREIAITITPDESAPFVLGDTWVFRTYSRWRMKQVRGFGSIPIIRG